MLAMDLDGTLLNSLNRHKIVLDKVLADLSMDLDTNFYLDMKRRGFSTSKFLSNSGVEADLNIDICLRWRQLVENMEYLRHDFLYPKTEDFLSQVSKTYNLVLITARNNKQTALEQIKNLNISKHFKYIYIVASNVNTAKNKIDILKKHKLIAYIGDTEVDLEIAKALKLNFFALNYGLRNETFWNELGIKSFDNLLQINLNERSIL